MDNYYSVVSKILNLASKQNFVQEVHYGDAIDWLGSGDHKYCSFCVVEQPNNQFGEQFNIFNFVLYIVDRLEEDNSNLLEVHSNTKTIGEHLLRMMPDDWTIVNQSFTPFKYKFADLCAGNFVTISLQVPVEFVCEDDAWEPVILKIDKNGEYNLNGYDTALVNVHSTDVFNYFTLYPSNYIYANYLDLSTEIVANVKFTGDEDFYFCSDEKGLIGLYFDAKENETYAWWDGDRLALHFHKRDWDKGFYKIQFKAGRLQIGYLTWTLDSKSSTTSFDPLYFGYMSEKTSPMEIEYITISNQYGAAYDYRPKITDEYAELVEVISDKIADIRTVYSASELRLIDFVKNGGKLGYSVQPDYSYIETVAPYIGGNGDYAFYNNNVLSYKENLDFNFPNVTNASNMFARFVQHPVSESAVLHMPKLTYGGYCINRTGIAKHLIVETTPAFSNGTNFIQDNDNVVSVEITDCSGVNNTMTVGYCKNLTSVKLYNLGKAFKAKRTLSMTRNPSFTKEALLNLVETLYDISTNRYAVGSNILIDASLYNTLTDEDKLKITNKGWTLVAQ